MEPYVFTLPTRLILGPGTLDQLPSECARLFRRPALVTGRSTLERGGLRERLVRALRGSGVEPVFLPGVSPDPSCDACDDLARRARAEGADGVLAAGGGSAMDAGKAVAMLLSSPAPPPLANYLREWEGRCPEVPGRVPLALVPTTFGTGSEGNCGMVITDAERSHKLTFFHPALHADLAVVDPDLTSTLPERAMRRGLFDAFCHVADAHLTVKEEFPPSVAICEAILARLVALSADPAPDAARAELAHLSWLALCGLPDAGASGVYPLHDLAAPVTARLGVPHAEALALLFPALAAFSRADPAARGRMDRLHRLLDPAGETADFPSFLRAFIGRLGIRPALPAPGEETLYSMASDCVTLFGGGGMTVENSVPLHLHEMVEIYREAFSA